MPATPAAQGRPEHGGLPLPASLGAGGLCFPPRWPLGKGCPLQGEAGREEAELGLGGGHIHVQTQNRSRAAHRRPG